MFDSEARDTAIAADIFLRHYDALFAAAEPRYDYDYGAVSGRPRRRGRGDTRHPNDLGTHSARGELEKTRNIILKALPKVLERAGLERLREQ